MLSRLLTENRAEIVARSQIRTAERTGLCPTTPELAFGIPLFVDQLIEVLRSSADSEQVVPLARVHGRDLLQLGLPIAQVVHCYGDICQSVTDVAIEKMTSITAAEYQVLNRCLHDAMAAAVAEYARRREGELSTRQVERLGSFGHELRNLLNTAQLAFDAFQSGEENASTLLSRSLSDLGQLLDRAGAEAQGRAPGQTGPRVLFEELIEAAKTPTIVGSAPTPAAEPTVRAG